ncbi:hypothetical protein B7R25_16725 [Subtercola boreus]|uniref:Uncharacterized protein n=2 Tax=Subtercola boreus TaxID=120213 RepID=A0A3E0W5X9_9MICO|nr:hypothetical protein [Subtercola boreus]RFA17726.1 hypothetical protein B7R24_16560 [Subtercola boreus]RFA17735.1 hypothetical protein B7R23_16730 [Subtercola boreus]RFA24481.1 hypothetical protein B7R25_16725 [Subtercola boreus]
MLPYIAANILSLAALRVAFRSLSLIGTECLPGKKRSGEKKMTSTNNPPPTAPWPYPTTPLTVLGGAEVEADGDNQTCVCGNDSFSFDWMAADRTGRITFEGAGSSDGDECTVCPVCGRVYRNADLVDATGDRLAPALAQYDTTAPAFLAALRRYNRDAYEDQQ